MAIVPSGKMRIMKTQKFANPLSEGFENTVNNNIPSFETENGLEDEIGSSVPSVEETSKLQEQQEIEGDLSSPIEPIEKGNRQTLTNYVFKKLENYGYPGRRLQEFKTKFVRETVSPEGIKDIQIEIPDKKYPDNSGYADTIENEELSQISQEVNKMFGLNFNGAERTDGRWTIKFTSAEKSGIEDEGIARDNLDEIYGVPGGNKKKQPEMKSRKNTTTTANISTTQEMIKESKNRVINKLRQSEGKSYDTKNVR